jgi:predicted DNA-binding transcriptional regulator AlpA
MNNYLTVRDICSKLAITRQTLWRWRKQYGFPAPIRLGDRQRSVCRYNEAEVERWLREQQQSSPSPQGQSAS